MYSLQNILDKKDIDILLNLKDCIPGVYYKQFYNVFGCIHFTVDNSFFDITPIKKLRNERKIYTAYFLEYIEGSCTSLHTDGQANSTSITLLEDSNLQGGNIVVTNEISSVLDRFQDGPSKIIENSKYMYPEIIDLKEGETVEYSCKLTHGVTPVQTGIRTVFVVWYK